MGASMLPYIVVIFSAAVCGFLLSQWFFKLDISYESSALEEERLLLQSMNEVRDILHALLGRDDDARLIGSSGDRGSFASDHDDTLSEVETQRVRDIHRVEEQLREQVAIDWELRTRELTESLVASSSIHHEPQLFDKSLLSLNGSRNSSPACHNSDFSANSSLSSKQQMLMATLYDESIDATYSSLQKIHERQFPAVGCNRARLLLYSHWQPNVGLGSELHWLQVGLTAAILSNRTLVILEHEEPWIWVDASDEQCAGRRTFSCYFQPLSSCEVHSEQQLRDIVGPRQQWPDTVPNVTPLTLRMPEFNSFRVLNYTSDSGFARTVPDAFRARRNVVFWWRALLMRFLFRPRDWVHRWHEQRAALIDAEFEQRAPGHEQRASSSSLSASIHIRRGDKSNGNEYQVVEMADVDWQRSKQFLLSIDEHCSLRHVFLSSRDPHTITASLNDSDVDFRIKFDPFQLRYGNGFHTRDLEFGRLNSTLEALYYISDVLLLSNVDIFAGPMESNLSRLVAELAIAWRRLLIVPFALGESGYIVWP